MRVKAGSRLPLRLAGAAALLLLGAVVPGASAQVVEPRTPVERLAVGGRLNFQFNTSSVDGERSSEFLVRRARLWANGRVNDWIDGTLQLDFAAGHVEARMAYLRLWFGDGFQLTMGQFKRAFDLFELTSAYQTLVIERDGEIRGVDDCLGAGGVCSYSRLTEELELSSLDVGILATGSWSPSLGYSVSLTNGAGANEEDENSAKSVSGRLEWTPAPALVVAGNVALHDFPNPRTGEDEHAAAAGVDVEWGTFDGGAHLQAGVVAGDNWKELSPEGEPGRFLAAQAIATYRFDVSTERVHGVEPLLRISWADPHRDARGGEGWLLTPGLVLHFTGENKVSANLDVWAPDTGHGASSLKVQTFLYF